ncbi:MAG: DNA-binding protein [Bacteroidetes bacterium]|nr:DNA-binding protein [Bacteroidota bacterium]
MKQICLFIVFLAAAMQQLIAQQKLNTAVEETFKHPPESAKPWVFWYWMHGAVSKAGITADLEAMKEVGIGGAYLMTIKDTSASIPFQPQVRQLTPEWWEMVRFAMQEAKRLHLQLGMHFSDGFSLGGGPWITPALSMQKLVWTKTIVTTTDKDISLPQPEATENYYKDVAVFAYPVNYSIPVKEVVPVITASNGTTPQFLCVRDRNNKQSFKADSAAWIQYAYAQPFTCHAVTIHTGGNNFEALRLQLQTSDDGTRFVSVKQLQAPRHGWQDGTEDYTYSIPETTAKYFRFVYRKEGTEPGAEDLEQAKWKPSLKVMGIYLSREPMINQYEGKNGSVWRIASATAESEITQLDCVPFNAIQDITQKMDADGKLHWQPVSGQWIVVRMGHTSTGSTNATGGGAKGLECDKFNTAAIQLQFDNWFGKTFENCKTPVIKDVLKIFHTDSWECGSQNWSDNFLTEFKRRRGYDLKPYLITLTGVPINDAATSENILHDVRTTIAEMLNDIFFASLQKLAHQKGCSFSAESVAPTMVSDGMLHFKNTDIPMGEFWLNSPTHDKPNDMLDAISGAHLYGKNIIQAEAFTTVRMDWNEHSGNIKFLGDRNFALGANRLVLHVFTHNPWMDKKPGMTLDGVGLYYQRDQTWFKQSKAWIEYLTRCQALLQLGHPVMDIAVFAGEEVPRRAVLPDRLINTLPGIFGAEKVAAEKKRLENNGQPMRQIPDGVSNAANMYDAGDWVNPLNGYSFDSFNPDALQLMQVKDGAVVLPGGASYKILVIPGNMKMNPANWISTASVKKIISLVNDGATILMDSVYLNAVAQQDVSLSFKERIANWGKGKFVAAPYREDDFAKLGLPHDVSVNPLAATIEMSSLLPLNYGIQHRQWRNKDIYFITNQNNQYQTLNFNFRDNGLLPEIYDPVTGNISRPYSTETDKGQLTFFESFEPYESKFIIFEKKGIPFSMKGHEDEMMHLLKTIHPLPNDWTLSFPLSEKTITKILPAEALKSWTTFDEQAIKYYAGSVKYKTTYTYKKRMDSVMSMYLEFDSVCNIASVKINGTDCGSIWTKPYRVNVMNHLKEGANTIEITVTNTWHNRLIGDALFPAAERKTFTTAPFRLEGKALAPAGIIGMVNLEEEYYKKD